MSPLSQKVCPMDTGKKCFPMYGRELWGIGAIRPQNEKENLIKWATVKRETND